MSIASEEPSEALAQPASTASQRLGEELPLFCEKCGYSLQGLQRFRCEHCAILQFHCPECGHHQPINTLRPAFQRILGRARAWYLGLSVLLRISFFAIALFTWFIVGYEYSYGYGGYQPVFNWLPRNVSFDEVLAFVLWSLLFGAISRMLLLRWAVGGLVGACLGAVVLAAMLFGRMYFQMQPYDRNAQPAFPFFMLTLLVAAFITVGALIAWPLWISFVFIFLPKRIGKALLDWQRSLSENDGTLARE